MFCAGIARSLDLRNAVRTKPTRRSGASSCWNALHLGDALYRCRYRETSFESLAILRRHGHRRHTAFLQLS